MKIENLQIQNLKSPIGIDAKNPLLSYFLKSDQYDISQNAYRILVASEEELLQTDQGDMWDSGKITDARTFGILYEGKELLSRQRVFWKVMVWDNYDVPTSWSSVFFWEMGLLEEEDWTSKWIGREKERPSAPMFAKNFLTDKNKNIEKARLYACGLGLFEAFLNGTKIGDAFYEPGDTDYRKTVHYITYDITSQLQIGENAVGFILGNGQYRNYAKEYTLPEHYQKTDGWRDNESGFYGDTKCFAQLEIMYQDGTQQLINTSDDWHYTDSPIVFNNWYGGEEYDATKEIKDWCDFNQTYDNWNPVVIKEAPGGAQSAKLKAKEYPPIRIMEELTPISVKQIKNGNYLVDMGRNGAGFEKIILRGTTQDMAGTVVTMYPTEILNEDGSFNQYTCTQGDPGVIYDAYTIKGVGEENWHPSFAYHGYRYLEVKGFPGVPTVDNFRGYILRTDNEKTGDFHCSDESINTIDTIIKHSIESNMYSVFTDCPHIEKLGWLEVANLMFYSMSQTYDIRAWMRKIVGDVVDSQCDNGYIPAIAPECQRISPLAHDPNWSGVCTLIPWDYYEVYGDTSLMKLAYKTMVGYVIYLEEETRFNNHLIKFAQMGDWGAYDSSTPKELVASCAFYNIADTVSKTAEILGNKEDSVRFRGLSDDIKRSVNAKYYNNETGVYGTGSQASFACPLYAGLVEEENVYRTVDKLVEAVSACGYHLSTGEVALKQMITALAKYGRNDIVYKMATNKTQPSYWYFVTQGATTLPEYWDMKRSQNHAMMGHIKEWFGRHLVGISPITPGYKEFVIKPYIPEGLAYAEASVGSAYGTIYAEWNYIEGESITMNVNIPVGCVANIYVPNCLEAVHEVTVNGKVVITDKKNGYEKIMNAGSGEYVIKSSL